MGSSKGFTKALTDNEGFIRRLSMAEIVEGDGNLFSHCKKEEEKKKTRKFQDGYGIEDHEKLEPEANISVLPSPGRGLS